MGLNVVEETGSFKMSDNFNLFYRRWIPTGNPERVVVFIHGFGGHSGALKPLGGCLAAKGIAVYGLDLRGFGNSKEPDLPRGDTRDFKRHLQDLDETIHIIRNNFQLQKVYMLGHSLGGLYVLWYSAKHPDALDGLILESPAIDVKPKHSPEMRKKFPLLLATAPETMLETRRAVSQNGDQDEKEEIPLQDPLRATGFSVRYICNIGAILMKDKAFLNAANVKTPTLILQGDSDTEALPSGATRLFESLAAKDKTLKMFPSADHRLNDVGEQVCSAITEWLTLH